MKQSRLDFFLVSEKLLSIIDNEYILPGYRTDHSVKKIDITINDFKRERDSFILITHYLEIKTCNDCKKTFKKPIMNIERDYRQWDPISSYLFLLCAEKMGIVIRKK